METAISVTWVMAMLVLSFIAGIDFKMFLDAKAYRDGAF